MQLLVKSTKNLLLLNVVLMQLVKCAPIINNFDIWNDVNNTELTIYNNVNLERLPRVLNFFPVPFEEECLSTDRRRKGVCMNAYECNFQSGTSHGKCALGFGVCCIFTVTCNNEIFNNITYFVNPDFPDLSRDMSTCSLKVKKIDPEIAQLRLDFIHFNLGQPNRRTGVCDDDVFILSGGESKDLKLCGLNSGQHAYYDVENANDTITITMNLGSKIFSRLWEVRVTQIPFSERAPSGCLQYHTGIKGIVQTMNFADNGRHLADQDYNICMRQEVGMCSIAYEPCHENSFKLGPAVSGSAGTSIIGSIESSPSGSTGTSPLGSSPDSVFPGVSPISTSGITDAASGTNDESDIGSGDGIARMDTCDDNIYLPCDSEDLIITGDASLGLCHLGQCGESFCPVGEKNCRIESSVTPFTIGVQFGPGAREESPEDNLGMCLKYEQLACA